MVVYNLCSKCPDDLRGKCCHYAFLGYTNKNEPCNVILKNQICPFFNQKTKKCNVYKERFKKNPYCESILDCVKKGALVEGCLYLKKYKKHIQTPPKKLCLPDDLRLIDKKIYNYLEALSQDSFLKLFYPKLII